MSAGLKIVFAGTPGFAATTLQALIAGKHQVVAVYTPPDRPAGRGRKVRPGPVKELAVREGIPVRQPEGFDEGECQRLGALGADVMLVSAYGLLLPGAVLDIPRLGCVNIHTSLLPRWRGAAPIQRAILAGDRQTGVCIMQMVEELDAGPVLFRQHCGIRAGDTAATLKERLAQLAAREIAGVLEGLDENRLEPEPQDPQGVLYAPKIDKSEASIDWHESAVQIERKVRAFNDWPVACTWLGGQRVQVWEARLACGDNSRDPGAILDTRKGIEVATGDGVLGVAALQLPGGKRISARDFINAHDLHGQHFSSEAPG